MNITQQVGREASVNYELIDQALSIATQPLIHSGSAYYPGKIRRALESIRNPPTTLAPVEDAERPGAETDVVVPRYYEPGYQQVEDNDELTRLLVHLDERQRYAVIQRYAHREEYEVIGRALGVSRQAATGLAARGLSKLQKIAQEEN